MKSGENILTHDRSYTCFGWKLQTVVSEKIRVLCRSLLKLGARMQYYQIMRYLFNKTLVCDIRWWIDRWMMFTWPHHHTRFIKHPQAMSRNYVIIHYDGWIMCYWYITRDEVVLSLCATGRRYKLPFVPSCKMSYVLHRSVSWTPWSLVVFRYLR